ncbi:hypothetical protein Pelo_1707 [Pelomyxa schiedti]|nr:hypothetical protein Pelo_1707 [Pelomyxa schiedti]
MGIRPGHRGEGRGAQWWHRAQIFACQSSSTILEKLLARVPPPFWKNLGDITRITYSIAGASKQCENTFENSATSSSVRNPPKREYLSAEMIGCHPNGVDLSIELPDYHASAGLQQTVMVARIELLGDHILSNRYAFSLLVQLTNEKKIALKLQHDVGLEYNEIRVKFVCHSINIMQTTSKCPWELLQSTARITMWPLSFIPKITSCRAQ